MKRPSPLLRIATGQKLRKNRRVKIAINRELSWVSALAALSICGVLIAMALPAISVKGGHGMMTSTLSNMKQLHMATQAMVVDGVLKGDPALNWPGDTGSSFSHWSRSLVENGYLSTNDLCKLLSAPGVVVPSGKIPTSNTNGILVYAVREDSPTNTVFLTSANFTNTPTGGIPPDRAAKLFGNKGFVIFRKGGDGAILQARQAGNTSLIGGYVPLCQ